MNHIELAAKINELWRSCLPVDISSSCPTNEQIAQLIAAADAARSARLLAAANEMLATIIREVENT